MIVSTANVVGRVMMEAGPGPLGLWSVRGRTDIVQHHINTGDHPAVKQQVHQYPVARREEERKLVEYMLSIGIIQESNSAWSRPTLLVKKKDGSTRLCIDYC